MLFALKRLGSSHAVDWWSTRSSGPNCKIGSKQVPLVPVFSCAKSSTFLHIASGSSQTPILPLAGISSGGFLQGLWGVTCSYLLQTDFGILSTAIQHRFLTLPTSSYQHSVAHAFQKLKLALVCDMLAKFSMRLACTARQLARHRNSAKRVCASFSGWTSSPSMPKIHRMRQ